MSKKKKKGINQKIAGYYFFNRLIKCFCWTMILNISASASPVLNRGILFYAFVTSLEWRKDVPTVLLTTRAPQTHLNLINVLLRDYSFHEDSTKRYILKKVQVLFTHSIRKQKDLKLYKTRKLLTEKCSDATSMQICECFLKQTTSHLYE